VGKEQENEVRGLRQFEFGWGFYALKAVEFPKLTMPFTWSSEEG